MLVRTTKVPFLPLTTEQQAGSDTQSCREKEAIPVAKIAVWALRKVKNLIHTITADNGKEFAKHEGNCAKLEILFFANHTTHGERGCQ